MILKGGDCFEIVELPTFALSASAAALISMERMLLYSEKYSRKGYTKSHTGEQDYGLSFKSFCSLYCNGNISNETSKI